ncbi:MAG: hypothetical protein R3D25_20025 [Geminicoccaceae bacterium]
MTTITRVEVHVFGYEVEDLALPPHGAAASATSSGRRAGGCR